MNEQRGRIDTNSSLELAWAKSEAKLQKARAEQLFADNYKLRTRIAELERQLTDAKEDTARLNWLETQNKNASLHLYLGGPWRYFSTENPAQGSWKFDERMDLGKHETAREAIDAARKERG